jgi:hypothetical protein
VKHSGFLEEEYEDDDEHSLPAIVPLAESR